MPLKDVMTPEVAVITPAASIYEATTTMSHRDIGPLPVCEGERLVDMLTDRDITVRTVVAARDPLTTLGRDVMTPGVVYGFEDQDVQDAVRLMAQ
jgi:CBS domain-containing protein